MSSILIPLLAGLLAGVLRGLVGYFKNAELEEFEWKRFVKTVVIAGVLGLIIGLFTPDWKLAFALAFTGDVAVEELLKGIIRREEG